MTEDQKEILIAKMLDAPSSLSDEELDSILHDDELRGIYEASAALSNAYIRQPELDMKAEWTHFRPRIQRKPAALRWVMRVAAIFLGVVLASNIATRIIDNIFTIDPPSAIANVEQPQEFNNVPAMPHTLQANEAREEEAEKEPAIVRKHSSADNRLLAQAQTARPNATATQGGADVDIDEYLRVQQARIDNDLAMQLAESYIEEYADLVELLDAPGTYNPALDNMIRKVTLE